MSLDAAYPWLKALHVAAALTFVGGLILSSVFLQATAADLPVAMAMAKAVRRWDRMVTTPAMLLVWALGLTMAVTAHWFTAGWLQLKFIVVVVLSALHGMQSGRLRRLTGGAAVKSLAFAPWVVACAIIIALLAVAKPF